MPRLWDHTIESHREAVRDAILTTMSRLVAAHGLASVTMSQIAEDAGIGRATLYKYFPDVDAILHAWHGRQIAEHVDHLSRARDAAPPEERLAAVLTAYGMVAFGSRDHGDTDLAALLHRDEHVVRAQRHVVALVRDLVADAARRGEVRDDVRPEELARYALHALTAARDARSKAAVQRLVQITLAGLRPPPRTARSARPRP